MARFSAKRAFAGLAMIAALLLQAAEARSAGALYDMNRFLQQPHPFAGAPSGYPPQTAAPPPAVQPQRRAPTASMKSTARPAAEVPQMATSGSWSDGWLSEVRGGVLKHAMSMIGNETKETGVDANLEVLFASPGWLKWLWSPRPHIGASFNASSTNTDIAYGGLTWEWKPWRGLFADFSFGFAVHNGELDYDADTAFPADAGRHREFGCRALFRESLELGWIFAKRHGVSMMWSHYSHGGLCADQNEGLDNLGIRYGYRF